MREKKTEQRKNDGFSKDRQGRQERNLRAQRREQQEERAGRRKQEWAEKRDGQGSREKQREKDKAGKKGRQAPKSGDRRTEWWQQEERDRRRKQDRPGAWEGKGGKKEQGRQTGRQGNQEGKKQEGNARRGTARSRCPVFDKCGGCQFINVPYEKQLEQKKREMAELLRPFCKLGTVHGMEKPEHYRNKVSAAFAHDKKGNPVSGVYREGTHYVVPVKSCLIEDEKADEIIGSIRGMLKSFKIKVYDEDTGYGLLRHVLVRIGKTSGQIMVVLVLSSPVFPSKNNFVKALREKHPEITTIILNVNEKNTSMVLGEKEHVLYGKGYIEDELCGKIFKISPKSFYQVNPVQTEVLYRRAVEFAGLTGKETVIDAYCGIGTIGLIAADRAKKVIGVELNKDAVRDAVFNAKRNHIKNVDFYNKDAGEFMVQLAEQEEHADVVFLDPPRTGSDETFLSSVVKLAPDRVVYVSCNPETLVRDLKYLEKNGYRVRKAEGVDMFPFCAHVECVVGMQKRCM